MRVSIITPSYNQASFLEQTILSVLDSDMPGVEYFVMDGGSTDGSVEIIRKYSKRITYWQSQPDGGQADAVNIGWGKAHGEILGWLNSDDRYVTGSMQKVAAAYRENPGAALLYGDMEEIDSEGRILRTKRMAGFERMSLLLGKNMGQPSVFTTRKVWNTLGGLRTDLHYALDLDYFLRVWFAFPQKDYVYVQAVLAQSRIWEMTKSISQADRWGPEYRRVLDDFFRRPDLPLDVRSLRAKAYGRVVRMRQARLYLDAADWRKGLPILLGAVILEPEWAEKFRMLRVGALTLFEANRRRRSSHEGKIP